MAGPPKDDDDGDFLVQLNPYPAKPVGPTMELQTSDLANMSQSGVANAKPNLMIQLDTGETVELAPGWTQEGRGRGSDPAPSIIVDFQPETQVPAAPLPQARPVALPRAPERAPGLALVVLVYVLASLALALAIYERFLA